MTPAEIDDIREFYERRRSALFAYAVSVTGGVAAAEDVVHAVFAEVLARDFAPSELRPYVFRGIRNQMKRMTS